ncbi:hypothetical protein DPEC_G00075100 [Dallia pectoralis]|uniref:Uncharacterized protein n=1 Tax=Dallia pectoralis TaxID=75939 RepID=A0ACC2H3V7_DALPE|nr:hypothetical protein DPEC_G00075100 [Dallia pectoralis]
MFLSAIVWVSHGCVPTLQLHAGTASRRLAHGGTPACEQPPLVSEDVTNPAEVQHSPSGAKSKAIFLTIWVIFARSPWGSETSLSSCPASGSILTGKCHYMWICWCRVNSREQDRANMGISYFLWIATGGLDHQDFRDGRASDYLWPR